MKRLRATTLLIGLAFGALTSCSSSDTANDTTSVSATDAATTAAANAAASTTADPATENPGPAATLADEVEAPPTTAVDSATDAIAVTSPPPTAVTDVAVEPGQNDGTYVGAAADVTTTACKLDGSNWTMGGKVTNSSGADATYRIYVALNVPGSTETKALVQSDVRVPNGKTSDWSSTADVTDKDLVCILRVERAAAA